MEKFNNTLEHIQDQSTLVHLLRTKGLEDSEAQLALRQYVEKKEHQLIQENTTRAGAELALHMAYVYFVAGFIEYALECLNELEQANEGEEFYNEIKTVRMEMVEQLR